MGFSMRLLRRSEWLLIVYFLYTSLLALLLPLRSPVPVITCTLNLTVIGGFFLLAYADSLRRRPFLSIVRDWYPSPLMLLAYREMGWFAPTRHDYRLEQSWIIWDRILLNDLGLRTAIESLGPVIPSILELSYSLVYTMATFSVAMLYAYHKRERVDRFLTIFLFGILAAYALFPYFPSEPPRAVFPNEDLPGVLTPFRRFNLALLGGYGIHTSVFPSAHVSGAFSAAFAMFGILPEKRWVASVLLVLAVLITTATIYGRYHYAVDALAGFAISIAAVFAGRALFPRAAR
ncbi:MAG TPA: phosphatase PAP2 family protein [Bryobacteraceae bacterium]|nr:phosphatase PAP2 family protein [Bryobacteraceae bacterium]